MIQCLADAVHRWSVVLIAAVALAACSAGQDIDLANAAIAHFRELMAAQQFDRIYSEGSDELKKTTTEQSLTRLLGAIDRKLGPVKNAQSNGWNLNYNASGTSMTLRFKTQFEKGTGAETFVYRITGEKALLAGYHVNSDDLIIN
jgi:hypothetical protein